MLFLRHPLPRGWGGYHPLDLAICSKCVSVLCRKAWGVDATIVLYSSIYTAPVVGRRGLEAQTKESARRYVIYCVGLGHMFLLVGCGRGARPYVSIMRR